MGGSPDPPPPPDPFATSQAQAGANRDTAITTALLNYIDEDTPLGSVRYENDGYYRLQSQVGPNGESQGNGAPPQFFGYDGTTSGGAAAASAVPAGTSSSSGGSRTFDLAAYERDKKAFEASQHRDFGFAPPDINDPVYYNTGSGVSFGSGGGGGGGGSGAGFFTVPHFKRVTTLSPAQQELFDLENSLKKELLGFGNEQSIRLRDHLSEPISFDDISGYSVDGGAESRRRVEEALLSRVNPELDRQRGLLESRLASSGHVRGTEAYNREIDELNRTRVDANMQAALAGGQEESRIFALEQSRRQQEINEILALRNQPINEIGAIMNLGQVQIPQFAPPPQIPVGQTDLEGNVYRGYQGQVDAFRAQEAASASRFGSILGAGSTVLGSLFKPSDRRLKTNIERLATLANGFSLYAFTYIFGGSAQIGYMADEVRNVSPEAVANRGGFDYVNYSAVRLA